METYLYQAALYCAPCGEKIRADLRAKGEAPEDPDDERSYDSDDFPKGPFVDGGGEADTPAHCDACGVFLENPLTEDGAAYVREALDEHRLTGRGDAEVLRTWADHYGGELVYRAPGALPEDAEDLARGLAESEGWALDTWEALDEGIDGGDDAALAAWLRGLPGGELPPSMIRALRTYAGRDVTAEETTEIRAALLAHLDAMAEIRRAASKKW